MISNVQKGENRKGLSSFLFIVYNAYYISGYNSASHNSILILLFLLWNFVAYFENKSAYQRAIFCKPNMYLMLFMVFYFFSSVLVAGIGYTLKYMMIFLTFYGCLTQFLYYKNKKNYKEIKFIVILTLIVYLYFTIKAISFYTINPSAARVLAADNLAYDVIAIGGGYAIAFGAAIIVVGVFEMLLNDVITTTKFRKFLYWSIIVLLFVLVIKTESTTTLIAMIVGLLLTVINRIAYGKENRVQKNSDRKAIGTLLIAILLFFILLNLNNIGKFIMDLTGGDLENLLIRRFYRISEKLYYFGTGGGKENYVDSRLATVKTSLVTFLHYPLFGVGYKCGNVFSSLGSFGVGTHSEIGDMLAQHGIIGASLFFAFLFTGLKKAYENINCKNYIYTLLIMLILNPFRYYHGYFAVFTLIPMIGLLYSNRDLESKHGVIT